MNFPNLEELSLIIVLALPKASKIVDKAIILSLTWFSSALTVARYKIASLAFSVLPEPDLPVKIIDWSRFSLN